MRVLFLESSQTLHAGLPYGFRDAGHQVMISGLLTEQKLQEMINVHRPELIVMIGWGPELSLTQQKWICRNIQETKAPFVYWAVDDPVFTEAWSLPVSKRMQPDYVFTVSPASVAAYQQAGLRCAHLDFGFDSSSFYIKKTTTSPRHSIAVVAHACPAVYKHHGEQERMTSLHTLLRPLLYEKIQVDFYGRNWEQMRPFFGIDIPADWIREPVSPVNAARIYQQADIVIDLQPRGKQISQQLLEMLGSGGLVLTMDTPEVRRLFTPGRDLLTSSSPEQTLELVRTYLKLPDKREEIRQHGNRTGKQHTYEQRAKTLIRILQEEGILARDASRTDQSQGELFFFDYSALKSEKVHIVSHGDTLWEIGQKYQTSVDLIKKGNNLASDLIYVNQQLKIPVFSIEDSPNQRKVKNMLDKAAHLFHLDPTLLYGIAYAESSFGTNAGMSTAGAFGIMQLLAETAKELGVDRADPWQNILGGAIYMKELLREFDGDLLKALGAYNWGVNHVKQAVDEHGNQWLSHAPEETQHYVAKIMKYMDEAENE